MKLDKMQFAHVLAHCISNGMSSGEYEIEELDRRIDIDVPVQDSPKINSEELDKLLMLMAEGTRKIEAIKLYRQFTAAGLKDSKDAIERYWSRSVVYKDSMINKVQKQLDYLYQNVGYDEDFILEGLSVDQLIKVKEFISSFY